VDTDPDRMMEEALARLETERRKLGEMGRIWAEGRTTVRAKDQSLAMTFDGRGDLIELTFNGSKYRTVAPTELAQTILETLRRGRAQSLTKISEVMGTGEVPGLDVNGLMTGQADPQQMLDALIAPMLAGLGELSAPRTGERTDG
jgi:hypothetical protein